MFRINLLGALLMAAHVASAQTPAAPASPKAKAPQPSMCAACHTLEPNQMGGYFETAAFKSQSMQIDVGAAAPQILRFDPKALKVIDAGVEKTPEHLREAKKRHEVQVTFVEKDGLKVVSEIRFKGPAKIAPANLIDYAGVAKLVAEGPAKTPYTLIDSRPLVRFQEGAIPSAIHLPFIGFDKFVDRLPKDKNQLVVFYCGGLTCTLSPNSLKKAKLLGYTNLRVYREGQPEWATRNVQVTTPVFVKAAYVDRDIPHVMIDARTAQDATSGHIKGAVSVPAGQEKAVLKSLPRAKLNAPLIVYDGRGGDQAMTVAQALVKAGQQNVLVLNGGMIGWQAAAYPIESGTPALTQIAYAPKPRAGSIPMAEFTTLAKNTPADVLILDVRNPDEAAQGMIKGALLIPDEELAARMGEVSKGKRVVTHCLTGIRAEMAYHKLKEAGYNAAFLNNEIEVAKDGSFKITPK
ncbi:MAG TPA: rhodanese-like domain-containing protein [Rubrivivax sp.]|nr:rhodanese-like domain-containing protein [Rubrivivax sp.]